MALTISIFRETVPFKGGAIDLRGLSFPDISQLVNANRDVITAIYNKYTGLSPDTVDDTQLSEVLAELVTQAPGVVAHAILLSADLEASELGNVSKIPIGAQIEIVQKIFELTFATENGLGNLMAALGAAVRGVVASTKARRP